MIKVNEYFSGNVKSLGLQTAQGPATVGVMAAGDYEFGTSSKELMKVISGRLSVKLPESPAWQEFAEGQSFSVAPGKKFLVKAAAETAYICWYS
ncbi:MAG TPA: pyrimidine/purine nucleoside phosphorylase [Spirochaetales bacterium]|nr:pyrimidine/purine nucleoside phosphorylase [Spirochaetales bacterium]HRY55863.1 pyrimidine/purine nucleoside phosphorylase [Spirochaetia bacterium]HRZ65412.1 pyrimidine/purine nucleoside phosphorylase [Spirochaetia bacterium]